MMHRYFGLMRIFGRPAHTQAAMQTLARTQGLERVTLCGLFTETEQFTLAQMQLMAERCGLELHDWIAVPQESRRSFRLALALMRVAVDSLGYGRCLWYENDVVCNSDWLEKLEALYDRVSAIPGTPPILWSQAINYSLPSINKIRKDGYILAHRSGKVAMMIDAPMVRRIPLFHERWTRLKTSDSIIEEMFAADPVTRPRFLWPVNSMVDHVGRRGVSTPDDEAFELSRGIGFLPEPHVVEATAWLWEHEEAEAPTWLD